MYYYGGLRQSRLVVQVVCFFLLLCMIRTSAVSCRLLSPSYAFNCLCLLFIVWRSVVRLPPVIVFPTMVSGYTLLGLGTARYYYCVLYLLFFVSCQTTSSKEYAYRVGKDSFSTTDLFLVIRPPPQARMFFKMPPPSEIYDRLYF